jgi:hypothetical protein
LDWKTRNSELATSHLGEYFDELWRFKSVRRFVLAAGLVFVSMMFIRIASGVWAMAVLNAELVKYREVGQLVLVSDYNSALEATRQGCNAALLYEQAMEELVFVSDSGIGIGDFIENDERFETDSSAANQLIQENAEALRLIRNARDRTDVAWSSRLGRLQTAQSTPHLQRQLGKLLWLVSSYHFRCENQSQAVAALQDLH